VLGDILGLLGLFLGTQAVQAGNSFTLFLVILLLSMLQRTWGASVFQSL
jgi:hypothetical protein